MKFDPELLSIFSPRRGVGGTGAPACSQKAAAPTVSISRWVNEPPPALGEILTAHDVARLTRRRRWLVHALTLLGRFPKQQRFHDRAIGWGKHDVLNWIAENATTSHRLHTLRRLRSQLTVAPPVAIRCARTRRGRLPCSRQRRGGRL